MLAHRIPHDVAHATNAAAILNSVSHYFLKPLPYVAFQMVSQVIVDTSSWLF